MSEIQGIGRFTFHEGKLDEFKRLATQAVEIVRAQDTGTLQFELYFNADQSECILLERYRDSEALLDHGAHVADLMPALLATGTGSSVMLGDPSPELRAMMAGGPVKLFTPFLSM